jgi:hypothetical protein
MSLFDIKHFQNILVKFLGHEIKIEELRNIVFSYYETEENIKLDEKLEILFPHLLNFLTYDEAFGEPNLHKKLFRLNKVIEEAPISNESIQFALKFEQIMTIQNKFIDKKINEQTYREQIRKLTPLDFDVDKVMLWAKKHIKEQEIVLEKMQ